MRALGLALAALLVLSALASGEPAPTQAERALAWLADAPNPPQPPYLVEAAAQAGVDPKSWPPGAPVFSKLAPYDHGDGPYYSYARIAHAVGSSGYDPRNVNGVDYVALVRGGFAAGQSGSTTWVNDDAWAILALRAAGVPASDEQIRASVRTLRATQLPDGGWSYSVGALKGSTDVTGAALAALAAAGEPMRDFASARAFLDATYNPTWKGHVDNTGIGVNCQSTVWALHGYAALGVPARAESLDYVRGLQRASGGVARNVNQTEGDAFCTAEAIVILAGARYPLPSYAPLATPRPTIHAGESATLAAPGGFSSATWSFADETLVGRSVTKRFDAAGVYPYDVVAEGAGTRGRARGEVEVLTARPTLGELPDALAAFRRENVTLDLAAARDADGEIAVIEVDWGDGNRTSAPERLQRHAYERPGAYAARVRAQDDAGAWSDARVVLVNVRNRAPELAPLPARLVADRAHDVALQAGAIDPDGDAVSLRWRVGALEGAGAPAFRPATLGNHTLELVAEDGWGGAASANVTVEVVNLAPTIEIAAPASAAPGVRVPLRANASDADDGAPRVTWTVAGRTLEGADVEVALEAGTHAIVATARDPWGATATARRTLVVEEEPVTRVAPEIRAFDATLREGALALDLDVAPAASALVLRWTSDAGDGEAPVSAGTSLLAFPTARAATLTLVATHDGLEASRELAVARPAQARALDAPRVQGPDAPVVAGAEATFRADAVEGAVDYRFAFDEGAPTAWSAAREARHAWTTPGAHEVRVTARAADGRTSSATLSVVVLPAFAPEEAPLEAAPIDAVAAAQLSPAPQETRPAPAGVLAPAALALACLLWRGRRAR